MAVRRVAVVTAAALLTPLVAWTAAPPASGGVQVLGAAPASRCYPSTDNGDPVLTGLDVSPREVDARSGTQQVRFRVTAVDTGGPGAPTGVVGGAVYVSFDGTDSWNLFTRLEPESPGVLTGDLAILEQYATATRYLAVDLEDANGNLTHYTTDDIAALGIATTFHTTARGPDTRSPRVTAVKLSTRTVDTRTRPSGFRIRVHATDDFGVAGIRVWLWGSPVRSSGGRLRLVSGTRTDGDWAGRVRVPMWQGTGTAKLAVELTDETGRGRFYGPRKLTAIEQPGTVRVVSRDEPEPPRVEVRSASPSTVDLSTTGASLVVRARVTDRGSGVRRAAVSIRGPESADGNSGLDARMSLASGDRRAGTWTATVPLDPCHETAGRYTVTVFAWDAAEGDYTTSRQKVTVVNTDIVRPSVGIASDFEQVRRSGPVDLLFTEDVVGLTPEVAQVRVGRADRVTPTDPTVQVAGSWSCADAAGAPVDCVAGPVRSAAFTPTAPMAAATEHSVVLNPEHTLGVTDPSGNPLRSGGITTFRTL